MTNKERKIAGDFNCHADGVIRHGAHCPMENIRGFTQNQSHGMPSLVECLCCIAAAAAMVINFK